MTYRATAPFIVYLSQWLSPIASSGAPIPKLNPSKLSLITVVTQLVNCHIFHGFGFWHAFLLLEYKKFCKILQNYV